MRRERDEEGERWEGEKRRKKVEGGRNSKWNKFTKQ